MSNHSNPNYRRSTRHFSVSQINTIGARDGWACIYCGTTTGIVIDHVIPASKKGVTWISNGVCCCKRCNAEKKGDLHQDMITRGLFWLSMHGENTDWVDKLDSA